MNQSCERCILPPRFYAMIENSDNPLRSHIEQLCGNCLHKAIKNSEVIDQWNEAEWNKEDQEVNRPNLE